MLALIASFTDYNFFIYTLKFTLKHNKNDQKFNLYTVASVVNSDCLLPPCPQQFRRIRVLVKYACLTSKPGLLFLLHTILICGRTTDSLHLGNKMKF